MVHNGVGGRLRLYRQLRNMTQESLSEVIGVTKQHLGQIERGQCNPSLDFLSKAAAALNTQVANFFLGNSHDPSVDNDSTSQEAGRVQPFAGCGVWTISGSAGKNLWSRSLCRMLGYASVRVPSLAKFSKHLATGGAETFRVFFAHIYPSDVADVCRRGNEGVFSSGRPVRTEEWRCWAAREPRWSTSAAARRP